MYTLVIYYYDLLFILPHCKKYEENGKTALFRPLFVSLTGKKGEYLKKNPYICHQIHKKTNEAEKLKVCSNNYKILPELSLSVLVSFLHFCSQRLEP